jgi:hypothetical protein
VANIQGGNNTSGLANVDANYDLMTTTPQVSTAYGGTTAAPAYVGATRMFCENDGGDLNGSPWLNSPFVTYDNNLQVGVVTPLFDYAFNGTTQDTSMWYYASSTMTMTVSGGYLLANATNIGTASTGVYLQSKRYFNLTSNAGLRFGAVISINLAVAANEVWYIGLGIPASTTAAPTDGVYFQYSNAGLIGVLAYNGIITQTGALPTINPMTLSVNSAALLQIRVHDRSIGFLYNGFILGVISTPSSEGIPFLSDALPVFIQYVNTGTVAGSSFMQLKVSTMSMDQLDSNLSKPYPHIQAGKGLMAYQGQQGGTMGTTALYANNSTTGAGAALTNTTATGFTGLGGQYTYTPTLATSTDGILCSYQNPTGGINQTPRTMYITGVRIQSLVTIALTGGPVYALYSLAFGHTAVSLATGESTTFASVTTKASRRIALGMEVFPATSTLGTVSTTNFPIIMQFSSPITINPGEFIAIAVKNVGTVTSAGTITSLVTFDAYLE